jgi:branched-chain amino acid aminotransferase
MLLLMAGSQDFVSDLRNRDALIYLNGDLVPREAAKVSIFDGGFVVGDGVWARLVMSFAGNRHASLSIA